MPQGSIYSCLIMLFAFPVEVLKAPRLDLLGLIVLFASPVEVLKTPRLDLLVFYIVICVPTGSCRHGTGVSPKPARDIGGYRNSQNSQYSIYRNKHTEKPAALPHPTRTCVPEGTVRI